MRGGRKRAQSQSAVCVEAARYAQPSDPRKCSALAPMAPTTQTQPSHPTPCTTPPARPCAPQLVANKSIRQHVIMCGGHEKMQQLQSVLRRHAGHRVIIFCSTKRMCDQLCFSVGREYRAAAIHGDKRQQVRVRTAAGGGNIAEKHAQSVNRRRAPPSVGRNTPTGVWASRGRHLLPPPTRLAPPSTSPAGPHLNPLPTPRSATLCWPRSRTGASRC